MRKMISHNEKGVVFVIVIMVVIVMMILAVSIISMNTSQTMVSMNEIHNARCELLVLGYRAQYETLNFNLDPANYLCQSDGTTPHAMCNAQEVIDGVIYQMAVSKDPASDELSIRCEPQI